MYAVTLITYGLLPLPLQKLDEVLRVLEAPISTPFDNKRGPLRPRRSSDKPGGSQHTHIDNHPVQTLPELQIWLGGQLSGIERRIGRLEAARQEQQRESARERVRDRYQSAQRAMPGNSPLAAAAGAATGAFPYNP